MRLAANFTLKSPTTVSTPQRAEGEWRWQIFPYRALQHGSQTALGLLENVNGKRRA
jgi:hypothetical protein